MFYLYAFCFTVHIACSGGLKPTGILVTSLGGSRDLVDKTNYIIDHVIDSGMLTYPTVTVASLVSINDRTTMDSPFLYNGYEVSEFT